MVAWWQWYRLFATVWVRIYMVLILDTPILHMEIQS